MENEFSGNLFLYIDATLSSPNLSNKESRMKKRIIYITLPLFLLFLLPSPTFGEEDTFYNPLREQLRSHLYLIQNYEIREISQARIRAGHLMVDFYERRGFELAWLENGSISKAGSILFSLLWDAKEEGLFPEDYHLNTISGIWMELNREEESIDLQHIVNMDLLLSNAFFIYASDRLTGRINQNTLQREWLKRTPFDLVSFLEDILKESEPEYLFSRLQPPHQEYHQLLLALSDYLEIIKEGDWSFHLQGEVLKEGDHSKEVNLLRERLMREPIQPRDLHSEKGDYFDEELKKALLDFQMRYGLEETGELDLATRRALHQSAQSIVETISINLERLRWLPLNLGEEYILVNLPQYFLKLVKEEETIMDMRVIIGHLQQKTPAFHSRISHLVLSPRWYIPTSLSLRKYLPMVREDPEELKEMRIRVYERTEEGFIQKDPYSIDWEKVDTNNFKYYFWQDAGPWNRLGEVIFMFQNPYHVYLHDTPDKDLFNQRVRTFSEGCIRIEKPIELALYLLTDQGWTHEDIKAVVERRLEGTVFLSRSIPIYIQYCTAWVDQDGVLHLRDDIYREDLPLKKVYFP